MCIRDSPRGPTSITGTARFISAIFYIASTPLSGHTPEPMGESGERWSVVRLEQQTHYLTDDLVDPGRHAQRTPGPVLFRDVHASCRGETVTLVAHRIDDAFDFARGHAIHCLLCDPGRHRALVRVDAPVGQQIQLRVEQLSIQFLTRQATPAAFTQDTQHRFGALHFAYLLVPRCPITCAPSPLRTAFPSSLAGRDSGDYYGHSVAIGLAPRRRSHVRPGRT